MFFVGWRVSFFLSAVEKASEVVPGSLPRIKKSAACVPSGRGGFVFLPVFSLLASVKTSSLQEKTHCSLMLLRRFTSRVFFFFTSSACIYPCKNLLWFELHSGGFCMMCLRLTSVSCLSLIGPVRAMEPWLTWVDFLGWRPNHLAPSQTPAGPKLRQHNRWALKGPTTSALLQERWRGG